MSFVFEYKKYFLKAYVSPILDEFGGVMSLVVEFSNKTMEIDTQREIDLIMRSALRGYFSKRVNLENKPGSILVLSRSLNLFLESMENFL